jgi:murein L,D-transpeptidase YafK
MRSLLRVFILALLAMAACYYFYPYEAMPSTAVIDKIEVYKSKHELLAYSNGQEIKSFLVALGRNSSGPKLLEGDMKTPEGAYFISSKNANSNFHKSLLLSYPNKNDKAVAQRMKSEPGGCVEIHGLRNEYAFLRRFQR